MKIDELIAKVANEGAAMRYQWLAECVTNARLYNYEATKKRPERKYTEIAFRVENEVGQDFLAGGEQYVSIVLWMPKTEVEKIIDSLPPILKKEGEK